MPQRLDRRWSCSERVERSTGPLDVVVVVREQEVEVLRRSWAVVKAHGIPADRAESRARRTSRPTAHENGRLSFSTVGAGATVAWGAAQAEKRCQAALCASLS